MTRRRWIADTFTPDPTRGEPRPTHAALLGDQAAHLARVLRAQPGEVFDIVAAGFLHRAEVVAVTPARVDFLLHEELEADNALPLHLYLAVFKFDHFEWAIEKATELGVSAITPILARRTEKHLAQAAPKRAERWRRITHEASRQSRRATVPTLHSPIPLKLALPNEQAPTRILLSETEQANTLAQALVQPTGKPDAPGPGSPASELARWGGTLDSETRIEPPPTPEGITHALATGPEGGWTPEEILLFTQRAWTHATLGPRILRAETAAIAAIAIAGAILG